MNLAILLASLDSLGALVGLRIWPAWLGGLALGSVMLAMLFVAGRPLSVSSGYADVCATPTDPAARRSWRLFFLLGIGGGGLLSALLAGDFAPHASMGIFDDAITSSLTIKSLAVVVGGMATGFGARLAGGCTSGHSIVGLSQLAAGSLLATVGFMLGGIAVANLMYGVLAG